MIKQIERYIPKDYELYRSEPELGIEIYKREQAGKLSAQCYIGRAVKPTWFYLFRTIEKLDAYIADTIANRKTTMAYKAKIKAERSAPVAFKVGDIFKAVWGYDQTNVDYYEITKVIGKATAEIRKIGCMSEETGFMSGNSAPTPGKYVGEPMIKRIKNVGGKPAIAIESYCNAYLMEPTIVIAGAPIYESTGWTAYA